MDVSGNNSNSNLNLNSNSNLNDRKKHLNEDNDDNKSIFSDNSSYHLNNSKESSYNRGKGGNLNEIEDPESKNNYTDDENKKFVMKNGCCRDCMRAFSKTGKSCLCQVPKMERNYTLPDKGCHFCGCHGKTKTKI